MRQGHSVRRVYLWWLAMAVIGLSLLSLGIPEVAAQATAPPDHLKCYAVAGDRHQPDPKFRKHIVDLMNDQFGPEQCKLTDHAKLFCAPTTKVAVDGQPPPGQPGQQLVNDFICYSVTCKPPQKHTFRAVDQFAQRDMKITNAKMLCAPAQKFSTPAAD